MPLTYLAVLVSTLITGFKNPSFCSLALFFTVILKPSPFSSGVTVTELRPKSLLSILISLLLVPEPVILIFLPASIFTEVSAPLPASKIIFPTPPLALVLPKSAPLVISVFKE